MIAIVTRCFCRGAFACGVEHKIRLTAEAYLGIVRRDQFQHACGKMMEYYYADRFQMAVAGTPISSNMTRASS